jgi:hypothetical protein
MKNEICVVRVEITNIDSEGFWLRCREEELYLSFAMFPWFEHATVAQLCNIQCFGGTCLYWPALDLELGIDTIRGAVTAQLAYRSPPNRS